MSGLLTVETLYIIGPLCSLPRNGGLYPKYALALPVENQMPPCDTERVNETDIHYDLTERYLQNLNRYQHPFFISVLILLRDSTKSAITDAMFLFFSDPNILSTRLSKSGLSSYFLHIANALNKKLTSL